VLDQSKKHTMSLLMILNSMLQLTTGRQKRHLHTTCK